MPESSERIGLHYGADANTRNETVEWALGLLERALRERHIELVREGGATRVIRIASGNDADQDAEGCRRYAAALARGLCALSRRQ